MRRINARPCECKSGQRNEADPARRCDRDGFEFSLLGLLAIRGLIFSNPRFVDVCQHWRDLGDVSHL